MKFLMLLMLFASSSFAHAYVECDAQDVYKYANGNIVGDDGMFRLGDIGLSRQFKSHTKTRDCTSRVSYFGTVDWMNGRSDAVYLHYTVTNIVNHSFDSTNLRPVLENSPNGPKFELGRLAFVDKGISGAGSEISFRATTDEDISNIKVTREFMEELSTALKSGVIVISNNFTISASGDLKPRALADQTISSIREIIGKLEAPSQQLLDLLAIRKNLDNETTELNSCIEKFVYGRPHKRWETGWINGYETDFEKIITNYSNELDEIQRLKRIYCR